MLGLREFPRILKPLFGAQLNASHPLAQGLQARWLMNENGGDVINDVTKNGNIGKLISSPVWVSQRNGPAILFSGSNYIDVPNSTSININGALSICFWFSTPTGNGTGS